MSFAWIDLSTVPFKVMPVSLSMLMYLTSGVLQRNLELHDIDNVDNGNESITIQ